MRVEKWQALGNDYLIVDQAHLPWPLTPGRVRLLCDSHFGVGADGVLLISPSDQPGFAAELAIHNPDGSEAELSGNGAREAIMYLRRSGQVKTEEFSILTRAGEIRARVLDERSCTMSMGRAHLSSADFPGGPDDGRSTLDFDGDQRAFQHVQVGNPQASFLVATEAELAELDLQAIGPAIEHHAAFPNRTNASFYSVLAPDRIRARIFERGVGETSASGTGASGAAIAHVLRGGDSPVTVELDGGELVVDVDESLLFTLTGWAEPVFGADLSPELMSRLSAAGD